MTDFSNLLEEHPRPWESIKIDYKSIPSVIMAKDANGEIIPRICGIKDFVGKTASGNKLFNDLIVHAVNSLQSIEEARAEGRKELGDKILVEMCKHENQKYKPIIDLIAELTKGDG